MMYFTILIFKYYYYCFIFIFLKPNKSKRALKKWKRIRKAKKQPFLYGHKTDAIQTNNQKLTNNLNNCTKSKTTNCSDQNKSDIDNMNKMQLNSHHFTNRKKNSNVIQINHLFKNPFLFDQTKFQRFYFFSSGFFFLIQKSLFFSVVRSLLNLSTKKVIHAVEFDGQQTTII